MKDFHRLKVQDINKVTSTTSIVELAVPNDLEDVFTYKPGQYLTLRTFLDGEEVRRSYSLCSSPVDNKWRVGIKQIPNGRFSTFANSQLQVGDELEVMPPSGNFYIDVDTKKGRNYVGFAAGSGITPIFSIIKTHLSREPESTFKLFYVNQSVSSIILKEELEGLKNMFLNRLEIFYFLTKEQRDIELFNGRITKDKLHQLFATLCKVDQLDHSFICGPKEMIFLIRDELKTAGMNPKNIHYELFFSGDAADKDTAQPSEIKEALEGTQVTIIDGGKEFHFGMDGAHDNILDAALAAGADLPFACKGGVCSTCKCRVLEGSVEMKVNYALEEEEVANNFVLSCQAVPTSDAVKIDFDV